MYAIDKFLALSKRGVDPLSGMRESKQKRSFFQEEFEVFREAFTQLYQADTGLPMIVWVNTGWLTQGIAKEVIFQTNRESLPSKKQEDYAAIFFDTFEVIGLGKSDLSVDDVGCLLVWVHENISDLYKLQKGLIDLVDDFLCGETVQRLKNKYEAKCIKTEMSVLLSKEETHLPVKIRIDTDSDITTGVSIHYCEVEAIPDSKAKKPQDFKQHSSSQAVITFAVILSNTPHGRKYEFGSCSVNGLSAYFADICKEQVTEVISWIKARERIIISYKAREFDTKEYKRRMLSFPAS